MFATRRGNTAVVRWLVKMGGARISDTEGNGMTALMWAAYNSHFYVVQWLLEEGSANITDTVVVHGKSRSLWNHIRSKSEGSAVELTSLIKFMVLIVDAPPDFIAKMTPHDAKIALWGRRIRILRPLYLKQQEASIEALCPLPTVLHSIVAAYAEPTPECMWTEWARLVSNLFEQDGRLKMKEAPPVPIFHAERSFRERFPGFMTALCSRVKELIFRSDGYPRLSRSPPFPSLCPLCQHYLPMR
jgi:hypothetical protein